MAGLEFAALVHEIGCVKLFNILERVHCHQDRANERVYVVILIAFLCVGKECSVGEVEQSRVVVVVLPWRIGWKKKICFEKAEENLQRQHMLTVSFGPED